MLTKTEVTSVRGKTYGRACVSVVDVRLFATIRKGIPRRSPANAIRPVEMGLTAFPLDAEFDAVLTGLLCRQGSGGSSFRFGRAAGLRRGSAEALFSRLGAGFAPSTDAVSMAD